MKKILAALLVAAFTLTANIGCSGDTKKKDDTKKDTPAKDKDAAK